MTAISWTPLEKALHAWITRASGFAGGNVIWSGKASRRPDGPWISLLLTGAVRDGIGWVDTDPNPLAFAPLTYTANVTTDRLTSAAHGLFTGDGPVDPATTGTAPGGLHAGLDYWAIKIDANTLQLAESFLDAMASTPIPVDITSAGTGVQTLVSTDDTVRAGQEVLMTVRANYAAVLSVQCYAGTDGPYVGDTSPLAVLQNAAMRALLPSVRDALEDAGVGVSSIGPVNNVGAMISTTSWEPRAHMDVKLWVASEVSEAGTVIDTAEVTMTITDRQDVVFTAP